MADIHGRDQVSTVSIDALAEYGVTHIDMPLTPMMVWRAINGIS